MKVLSTQTSYLFKGRWLDLHIPTEVDSADLAEALALDGVIQADSELLDNHDGLHQAHAPDKEPFEPFTEKE